MYNTRNKVGNEGTVSLIDKNKGNQFGINSVQPEKVQSAADECKIDYQ